MDFRAAKRVRGRATSSRRAIEAISSALCGLPAPIGDPNDRHNEGLLLVKTGPTGNFASATAELTKVKGITLTELGWDIRKLGASGNVAGSHCGAGAPRWNVLTQDGVVHFIGCNSPPPAQMRSTTGWIRMRWDPALAFPPITPLDRVQRIQIVMDEGQDAGGAPDQFGPPCWTTFPSTGRSWVAAR